MLIRVSVGTSVRHHCVYICSQTGWPGPMITILVRFRNIKAGRSKSHTSWAAPQAAKTVMKTYEIG